MAYKKLVEYILNSKYHCPYCVELQKRVDAVGVEAIRDWDGMVCSSIEDMQIRLYEADTGKKWGPIDFSVFD